MNGEVDALTISESSAIDYSSGGRTKLVVTIAHQRSKLKPEIPTVYEMFQLAPEQKWWFDYRLGIKAFGGEAVIAGNIICSAMGRSGGRRCVGRRCCDHVHTDARAWEPERRVDSVGASACSR